MKLKRVYESDGRYYYVQDLAERSAATGARKKKWIALTRVEEGEAALLKALEQLIGAAPAATGNLPHWVAKFTAEKLPQLGSVDSQKEYRRMYDVIARLFGRYNAAEVEPGTVESFLDAPELAGKQNTRKKYKARLSQFFAWCARRPKETGVTVNPCAEIRLADPPKRKGKLNDALYWQVYDALTPMGQCFLELVYLTRQRPTEIRLLRESAIGETHIHFVPTKTEDSSGEEVDILITPEIRACLERARSLWPSRKAKVVELADRKRDHFIIQTRDGDGYTKTGLYEVWRDALEAVSLGGRNITTRDVRPYALHKMKEAGYDIDEIQLSAAHADRATTEGYLRQHRERLSNARLPLPPRKS